MKVLFGRDQISADLSWEQVAALLPGWEIAGCQPGEVAEHLDGVDVICPFGARISADVIEAGSFGLVHQFGVGLDTVDVAAATANGVLVARVPGDVSGNADSCAELSVLLLLALSRRLDESRAVLAARSWPDRPIGRSLLESTVLVVGLGSIGCAVARRLAPFGCRLLGVRARPELGGPAGLALITGPDQLPALLGEADAVICCAAAHDGTAGLFGAAQFAAMRRGALFVNIARGALVDEAALLAALDSGQLGGAGLDVFAQEPPDPDSPLAAHPRVIATPHVGWHTGYMFRRTSEVFAENLLRYGRGEPPLWTVNIPGLARGRVADGRTTEGGTADGRAECAPTAAAGPALTAATGPVPAAAVGPALTAATGPVPAAVTGPALTCRPVTSTDFDQIRRNLRASYGQDGAARREQRDKADWKLAERSAFVRRLQAADCTALLEVGAGTGQDSLFFAGHGLTVIATDLSAQMVARCRAKGLDARVMDLSRLEFRDGAFDAVHAMNCLLHVPNADLPGVLAEIARVLRPGGLFFLGVYGGTGTEGPADDDDHVPARFFSWRTDEQIVAYAREQFDVVDFHVVPMPGQHGFQSLTLARPQ